MHYMHTCTHATCTYLGEDDVGGSLGGVGGAGDGNADLGLGEGGGVINAVAGHADDLALRLEDTNHLVLVLGHDLCVCG